MKNIVFDVGMVLVNFRWPDYMRDKGFDEPTIKELGEKMICSSIWDELDLGISDEADLILQLKEKLSSYEHELDLFWSDLERLVEEYEYAGPLISRLKQEGYNVYLLSNYPKGMYEVHWKKFTFINNIDGFVVSSLEKMVKPDPQIYQLLLDRYQLEASDTVFIDDRAVNIEAARNLGITGILFKDYQLLLTEFNKLNILKF